MQTLAASGGASTLQGKNVLRTLNGGVRVLMSGPDFDRAVLRSRLHRLLVEYR